MASACRVPGGRPSFALRAFNGWGVVMTPVAGGSPIRMTVRAGHGGVPLAHGFDLPAKLRSPGILLHPLLEQGDLIDAPRGGVKDDAVADPDDIAEGVSPRGQQIAVSWSIALPRDIKRLGGQAAGGSFPGLGGFWMFVAEGELPGEAFRRAVTVLAAHLPLRGIGCGQITVPVHFDGGVAVLAQQPLARLLESPGIVGVNGPELAGPKVAWVEVAAETVLQWDTSPGLLGPRGQTHPGVSGSLDAMHEEPIRQRLRNGRIGSLIGATPAVGDMTGGAASTPVTPLRHAVAVVTGRRNWVGSLSRDAGWYGE